VREVVSSLPHILSQPTKDDRIEIVFRYQLLTHNFETKHMKKKVYHNALEFNSRTRLMRVIKVISRNTGSNKRRVVNMNFPSHIKSWSRYVSTCFQTPIGHSYCSNVLDVYCELLWYSLYILSLYFATIIRRSMAYEKDILMWVQVARARFLFQRPPVEKCSLAWLVHRGPNTRMEFVFRWDEWCHLSPRPARLLSVQAVEMFS
jgi:hypothetical protein